jgi:hypothetical protein
VPPSSPLRSTQRAVNAIPQYSPPSIPPVPASQRVEQAPQMQPPPELVVEEFAPRSKLQIVLIMLGVIVLAILVGLVAAKMSG